MNADNIIELVILVLELILQGSSRQSAIGKIVAEYGVSYEVLSKHILNRKP